MRPSQENARKIIQPKTGPEMAPVAATFSSPSLADHYHLLPL